MKIKPENGLLTPYSCSLTVLACFLGFDYMLQRSFSTYLKSGGKRSSISPFIFRSHVFILIHFHKVPAMVK